ncbi:O-antigen ligase family protein [Halarcobacter ebronensis]|uniref:O-antigen ligase-related domain-containing protein n=1 Tax=Halarcobacter ebronensis TaxID=1462615 RepID=A0A4Q1AMU6_9BACT|nr:O-antigen ligase family protein [Halarcobacter ebronensis]QKF82564.1 O-antigen ligase family protein [Halarcobacter ebronensis]RXK07423.1 hypothetical protein CRV07_02870 [Halarcobacter ebronensis]
MLNIKSLSSIPLERISYYSLIVFAFTLPLSRAAISFFLIWFVLLVILKRNYKNSFEKLKEKDIFKFIILYFIYIIISSFWGDDTTNTIRHLRLYSYWIILPAIVILIKKEWTNVILNAFFVGVFISELLSYSIYFNFGIIENTGGNIAPFMTSIHYSVFLAFTSLVLLYKITFEDKSLKIRILIISFFIMTFINLMISNGRTGQVAFLTTLIIFVIVKFRANIKKIIISLFFLISIMYFAYSNLNTFQTRVNTTVASINKAILNSNFDSSWGIRAAFWIITYDALKDRPFFGYGLGDYEIAAKKVIAEHDYKFMNENVKNFVTSYHYHNQYLMIAVEGGIIALFLFSLILYKLYKLRIEEIELKDISIIGLTTLLVSFVGDPMLFLQFPLVLFLFIVSLFISNSN